MEGWAYFESVTESGNPLEVEIKLHFYQDETPSGKLFWTYDIMKVSGVATCSSPFIGGDRTSYEYEVDEKEYAREIKKACDKELESFMEAA